MTDEVKSGKSVGKGIAFAACVLGCVYLATNGRSDLAGLMLVIAIVIW